ncbi:MAG: hypothetical protein D6714_00990, partial [Bacteroidetes bacterium]
MNVLYQTCLLGSLTFFSFFFLKNDSREPLPAESTTPATTLEIPVGTQMSLMTCPAGENEVRFVQCYTEADATPQTDRNDFFVCCAPPGWMPSEAYQFDANPVETDFPCVAGANLDGIKITITINSVTFDWTNYPCCADYLEGLYANLYDNCTAPTCGVTGDGLKNATPGMGDCSANGDHLNYDPATGTFPLGLPYTSVTDCMGFYVTTSESLGIDIVPSFLFEAANSAGCNCPQDAISQGVVSVDYDIEIEYIFCESALPANCAQVSFGNIGPLCENDPPFNLPTTSNEGYSGSWSPSSLNPAGQGGNTLQATFTPSQSCLPEVVLNVPVNSFVTPTFDPIADVCESDPLVPLQNVSNEGISGTWDVGNFFDPSQYPGQTVTLTFTPDAGECASTQTLNITVMAETQPTFLPIGPLCENDPPYFLPATSLEGITGNWQNGI